MKTQHRGFVLHQTPLLQQTQSVNLVMAFAQPVHSNPPEKRGKITKILFEIYMKYIKKKKGQCSIYQAYEVLHEYI